MSIVINIQNTTIFEPVILTFFYTCAKIISHKGASFLELLENPLYLVQWTKIFQHRINTLLASTLFIPLVSAETTPFSILAGASGTPDCLPGDSCHLNCWSPKKKQNNIKRNYWENLSIKNIKYKIDCTISF